MGSPAKVRVQTLRTLGAAFGALLLAYSWPAFSDEDKAPARVPVPKIAVEKPGKCVEDEEFMRRNHMNLLKHQRDETMRKGIRTTKYSLKNCIDCHASQKTGSVIGSNENFCQSCHSYVAVKLDCFECHASKPKAAAAFHPIVPSGAKAAGSAQAGLAGKMRWQMQASAAPTNPGGASK